MMALVPRLALLAPLVVPLLAAAPPAAAARPLATTRLISCGKGDCLLVRGHRGSPASRVRINDRMVAPRGGRDWSVRVPVATVRSWSRPFARTIDVAVIDPAGGIEDSGAIRLPVGLLGHDVELASLVVRAR